jgi:hypothetical protein
VVLCMLEVHMLVVGFINDHLVTSRVMNNIKISGNSSDQV